MALCLQPCCILWLGKHRGCSNFPPCAHITSLFTSFPLPQAPATLTLATTTASASWSQTEGTSSPTTSASALRGTTGCTARTVSTAGWGPGGLEVAAQAPLDLLPGGRGDPGDVPGAAPKLSRDTAWRRAPACASRSVGASLCRYLSPFFLGMVLGSPPEPLLLCPRQERVLLPALQKRRHLPGPGWRLHLQVPFSLLREVLPRP